LNGKIVEKKLILFNDCERMVIEAALVNGMPLPSSFSSVESMTISGPSPSLQFFHDEVRNHVLVVTLGWGWQDCEATMEFELERKFASNKGKPIYQGKGTGWQITNQGKLRLKFEGSEVWIEGPELPLETPLPTLDFFKNPFPQADKK
jgi:hypothetical protein